jgi:hypothetical protein
LTRHFVTIFDHRYLPRGLALYRSLLDHCSDFTLWVVALTPECWDYLTQHDYSNLIPVELGTIENKLLDLRVAKQNRSQVEYFYTLSSASCRYFIDKIPSGRILTYLDSDLFFYSSPEYIFSKLEGSSVGITPHRLSYRYRHQKSGGDFNVGWVSFRNDYDGKECLDWWYTESLNWCYARHEDGKYADQGYLNWFPGKFNGVKILNAPGINLAPWNLSGHKLKKTKNGIIIDGTPLVFFHFANFTQLSPIHYSTGTGMGMKWLSRTIRGDIFYPYIKTLRSVSPSVLPRGARQKFIFSREFNKIDIKYALGSFLALMRNIFLFQYIYVIKGKYI